MRLGDLPAVPPLRPPARAIFLAGFMAAGKSVVGRLLAQRTELPFMDTDEIVQRRAGRAISEIFATDGEAHFRRLETEALREAIAAGPAIVATGGGIMTRAENVALMRAAGPIVLLSVKPETVIQRTCGDTSRPLLATDAPLARARELLAARKRTYEQADYAVRADDATPDELADAICQLLAADPRAAALMPTPVRAHVQPADAPAYSIVVGRGVLASAGELLGPMIPEGAIVAVVTAEGPCQQIAGPLADVLSREWTVHVLSVPDTEDSKSIEQLTRLWTEFVGLGMDRSSWVVAVGGGMVGDLAATAAATYMRGIPLVHVPTTVLSQIDSSIGGKAAVNLPAAKNLVGAFHHPRVTLTDLSTLDTLPDQQFRDGLAEGIKHALLFDAELFEWLEQNMDELRARRPEAVKYFICRNIQLKAAVVSQDPRERHLRALLNFGHTIGHALERAAAGWHLSHGRAVAVGMVAEARAAAEMGCTPPEIVQRLQALLEAAGLPSGPVPADLSVAEAALLVDKKKTGGSLKLPVVEAVGRSAVVTGVPAEALMPYLRAAIRGSGGRR